MKNGALCVGAVVRRRVIRATAGHVHQSGSFVRVLKWRETNNPVTCLIQQNRKCFVYIGLASMFSRPSGNI